MHVLHGDSTLLYLIKRGGASLILSISTKALKWGHLCSFSNGKFDLQKLRLVSSPYNEINKCRGEESRGQESRMYHHSKLYSLLEGLSNPRMSAPTASRGACSWGNEDGIHSVNVATSLVASCWVTPKMCVKNFSYSSSSSYSSLAITK